MRESACCPRRRGRGSTLIALSTVYGDSGTSPRYTVRGVCEGQPVSELAILGTISTIIWTLTLLTTVKNGLIAMRADNQGEGGRLSRYALLRRLDRKSLYLPAIGGGGGATGPRWRSRVGSGPIQE